jgi:hypothetical protein
VSSFPRPDGTAQRGAPGPLVWFPDTSALVTLAVHEPLHGAVVSTLLGHRRVLVKAVVDELESLTSVTGPVAKWAFTALGQLDWLGTPVRLDDPAGTKLAVEIQEELSAGRPLRHPTEHYGESAIIALACRAQVFRPMLFSDDHDARIAAHTPSLVMQASAPAQAFQLPPSSHLPACASRR